jgi:hypothetical protein
MRVVGSSTTKAPACGSVFVGASFVVALVALAAAPPAEARPIYARQTNLPCGSCHINPQGGGPRNAFGRAFARNGHRLPGKAGEGRRHGGEGSMPERYRHMMDGGMMGPGMMGGDGR